MRNNGNSPRSIKGKVQAMSEAAWHQRLDEASPRLLFAAGSGAVAVALGYALGGPALGCLLALVAFGVAGGWIQGALAYLFALAAGTLAAVAALLLSGPVMLAAFGAGAVSLLAI